ncbi:hypothetical protein SDC9_168756 [bioreactor metagenome]|uniref:Uncharacterized protein n=1 Tax=bioreactor metagenome TaxID=1076179 RepID=A0A645G3B0_9ZZZZ
MATAPTTTAAILSTCTRPRRKSRSAAPRPGVTTTTPPASAQAASGYTSWQTASKSPPRLSTGRTGSTSSRTWTKQAMTAAWWPIPWSRTRFRAMTPSTTATTSPTSAGTAACPQSPASSAASAAMSSTTITGIRNGITTPKPRWATSWLPCTMKPGTRWARPLRTAAVTTASPAWNTARTL